MNRDQEILEMTKIMESHAQEQIEQIHERFLGASKNFPHLKSQMNLTLADEYSGLLGGDIPNYARAVNDLHESYVKRNDLTTAEVVNCLCYMFRIGEFLKFGRAAYDREHNHPEQPIQDASFWKSIEESFDKSEEAVRDIGGNMLFVLQSLAGEDWQDKMPDAIICFNLYTNYWNDHAKLR